MESPARSLQPIASIHLQTFLIRAGLNDLSFDNLMHRLQTGLALSVCKVNISKIDGRDYLKSGKKEQ